MMSEENNKELHIDKLNKQIKDMRTEICQNRKWKNKKVRKEMSKEIIKVLNW